MQNKNRFSKIKILKPWSNIFSGIRCQEGPRQNFSNRDRSDQPDHDNDAWMHVYQEDEAIRRSIQFTDQEAMTRSWWSVRAPHKNKALFPTGFFCGRLSINCLF